MIFDLRKRTNQYISNKLQLVKLKSGYLEGTIGMLHGEAQAELRTEFNMLKLCFLACFKKALVEFLTK